MRRILVRAGWALVIVWGIAATVITLGHQPGGRNSFFWLVLPYPLLYLLTKFIVSACASNGKSAEAGSNWFAGSVGAFASIGLGLAAASVFFTIIKLAYFGRVSGVGSSSAEPQYYMYTAINIAVAAGSSIWAGAIAAALSPQRSRHHALVAGGLLLLLSSAAMLLQRPLLVSQLVAAVILPIPLAIWGAWLQQAKGAASYPEP